MSEQNYTENRVFSIEKEATKGHISTFYSYKMSQLQSKVFFYEGQVDPLLHNNVALKDHLLELSKMISVSSDVLRSLLPTGDPNVKLKIEMANLYDLAKMMQQEIQWFKGQINTCNVNASELRKETQENDAKYQKLRLKKDRQISELKESSMNVEGQLREQIQIIKDRLQKMTEQTGIQIGKLQMKARVLQQELQTNIKRHEIQVGDLVQKNMNLQEIIQSLRHEMSGDTKKVEDGKKLVRGLYQKLMQQKLNEQRDVYEYMLKSKQQQKMALQMSKDQSQQQLNAAISRQNDSIKNLTGMITKNRTQITQLNDRVYAILDDVEIQRKQKQILQEQAKKFNQIRQSQKRRLMQTEEVLKRQELLKQETMRIHQKQKEQIRDEMNKVLNEIKEQKMQLQQKIVQNQSKMQEMQNAAGEVDDGWMVKLKQSQRLLKQQQFKYESELERNKQKINQQQKVIDQLKQQISQINFDLERGHLFVVQNLQVNYKNSRDDLVRQQQLEVRKLKDHHEEDLIALRQQLEQKIVSIQEENATEIIKIQANFIDDFKKNTAKLRKQRDQMQQKIVQARIRQRQMKAKISKYESKIQYQERMIEQSQNSYIKRIRKLQQEKEQDKANLDKIMEQQVNEFHKELQNQIGMMATIKDEMQGKIDELKDVTGISQIQKEKEKEVKQYKKQLSYDLKRKEQKFEKNIESLTQIHQNKLLESKERHEKLIDILKEDFSKTLDLVEEDWKKILIRIAESSQENDNFAQFRQIAGIKDGDLSTLDKQVLLGYVFKTVGKLHSNIRDLLGQIQELKSEVYLKKKLIQDMEENFDRIIDIKLQKKREEYEYLKKQLLSQMQSTTKDCKSKLESAHRQKVEYTKKLKQEFQYLRLEHDNRFRALQRKYDELQELFDDRPSRNDDVETIKNLQQLKEKMDIQMKGYQKKAETSNEIVKYLNLELENYKETYHIFGASTVTKESTELPSVQAKTLNFAGQTSSVQKNRGTQNLFQKYDKKKHSKTESAEKTANKTVTMNKFKDSMKSNQIGNFTPFKQADSAIRETNIFGSEVRKSGSIELGNLENLQVRDKRMSMPLKMDRIKRQTPKEQRQQIITNAQTFMRLMRIGSKNQSVVEQKDNESYLGKKRGSIRRRKFQKRLNTEQVQYF